MRREERAKGNGTKGPGYGSAKVYVDGVYLKTVNCKASSTQVRRILFCDTTGLLTNSTHTMTIADLATNGHPRIDIDGFVSFQSEPEGPHEVSHFDQEEGLTYR